MVKTIAKTFSNIIDSSFKEQCDEMVSKGLKNSDGEVLSVEQLHEMFYKFWTSTDDGSTPISPRKKRTKKASAVELWAKENKEKITKWREEHKEIKNDKEVLGNYQKGRGFVWENVDSDTKEKYDKMAKDQ